MLDPGLRSLALTKFVKQLNKCDAETVKRES
ncbi:hypothetical protein BH23VER1_BH23VER1_21900 [soil metagenome]